MSCAAYFNQRFDLGVAGPAVYALASGIGLARIVDGAHGTSDTFVGMAYGYAVGRGVAQRVLERRADAAERSLHPGLNPGLRITF